MKGIDKYHKVYIHRCSCFTHFMCIDYYKDEKYGYISMQIETPTLWERIKHICKYLWKGGTKAEYWGEIAFGEKDINEFIKFFKSLKEKQNNGKSKKI